MNATATAHQVTEVDSRTVCDICELTGLHLRVTEVAYVNGTNSRLCLGHAVEDETRNPSNTYRWVAAHKAW